MNINNRSTNIMPTHLSRIAMPAVLAFASLPAICHGANAEVSADTAAAELQPRKYMGETIYVPAKEFEYSDPKPSWWSQVRATGSIQTEFMLPMNDSELGLNKDNYEKPVLNNTYFDFTVNAPYISVGARFQWTKYPLPGFVKDFAGWGVPYFWATGRYKWFQLTAGDFYEQFGSGLILRTYQERSLGVDGALRGGRLKVNPGKGIYLTALVGKERYFWTHNPDLIWGADAEWSLNESFASAFGPSYGVNLGFSYVGKHNNDWTFSPTSDYKINFPKTIAAFDGRVKARLKDFNILAEFATKNNDPNAVNKYIFKRGHAELLSLSYAANGFSAYIQAKRSENMSFMSDQNQNGLNGNGIINHLPAFTNTQTYTLAAIYPYATNLNGEWAFQAELRYLFKRKTPLGGKYGTNVKLSASYISDLYKESPLGPDPNFKELATTNGYGSPFWKIGGLRYSDLNFELNKKVSRTFQFTFFYLLQRLNLNKIFSEVNGEINDANGVEGVNGDESSSANVTEIDPMVTANTFILEGQWKMAKKAQLRFELQYLTTKQDKGDWIAGLLEVSFAPHWMITLTDTYNAGTTKINYYSAMVTYTVKANRFSLSFGRNREGYNCSGGVCRWVPATKGFNLTYNYTF